MAGRFAVCKLPASSAVPEWALVAFANAAFVSLTRTANEVSLVAPESSLPPEKGVLVMEAGWRVLEVSGPLPFDLVGVLVGLTVPLARAGVPVFALSTFDTDYLLVKETDLPNAEKALRASGFLVSHHIVEASF